jgi:hypothetical protein
LQRRDFHRRRVAGGPKTVAGYPNEKGGSSMRTRTVLCLVVAVVVLLSPALAFGWASTISGATHYKMATNVLNSTFMAPYVAQFAAFGLDAGTIENTANTEPSTYSMGYYDIAAQNYLSWPLSNASVGGLMHSTCDNGMPVSHSPANEVYTNTVREAYFEAHVSTSLNPPALTSLLPGADYAAKTSAFHSAVIAQATDYKRSNSIWSGHYFDLQPWATPSMLNGEQWAECVLQNFFVAKGMSAGFRMAVGPTNLAPEPSMIVMLISLAGVGLVWRLRRR